MRGSLTHLLTGVVLAAVAFYLLTAPAPLDDDYGKGLVADVTAGQLVFAAGGCVSCHAAPEAKDEAKLVLSGGLPFASDFGTFYAPNISPDDAHGIGAWSLGEFARAVTKGVSPDGRHYYPAFPYTAYTHLTAQDVTNLFAYMRTLPASDTPNIAHLVEYFTSGFTPDYDSVGGGMAEVVSNLAQLPQSDRAAIAAYLKAIPAVE